MSENKFTPGPWEYLGDPDDDECRIRQAESVQYGRGYLSEITICENVRKQANADLIAAAPCLVEALQSLLPTLMSKSAMMDKNDWAAVNKAHAAIAKARGES